MLLSFGCFSFYQIFFQEAKWQGMVSTTFFQPADKQCAAPLVLLTACQQYSAREHFLWYLLKSKNLNHSITKTVSGFQTVIPVLPSHQKPTHGELIELIKVDRTDKIICKDVLFWKKMSYWVCQPGHRGDGLHWACSPAPRISSASLCSPTVPDKFSVLQH